MLSFLAQGIRFNVRAAAIIVHAGHLLVHRAEGEDFWTLPGGRVEPGETALDAVARELLEETGEMIQCGPLAFIAEHFFAWEGRAVHELGFYAHAALPADSRLLGKDASHAAFEQGVPLEFRWFALADRAELPLYPEFLRTRPLDRAQPVQHIVQGRPHGTQEHSTRGPPTPAP